MAISSLQTIAERFQWLRTQKGLTLAEVSERTGLGVSYLSRLANGSRPNPSAATTLALATFFGVNRDWLESGSGPVYPALVAESARRGVHDLLREIDVTLAGTSRLEQVLSNLAARVEQFRLSSDAQRSVYIQEIDRELAVYSEECAASYPRLKEALLRAARALSDEQAAKEVESGDQTNVPLS